MTRPGRLGLHGGSLDPVHYGHLDAAAAARERLSLDAVTFIPAHDPPHRTGEPQASGGHRFAMTALAIAPCASYRLSDVELARTGPSYTIDTLQHFHDEGWAASQLFFILGADAFAEIASWRAFPAVLDAAHFVVVARPGTSLDAALARTSALAPRVVREAARDTTGSNTSVILVEARTRDVSSTQVRERLRTSSSIAELVPEAVAAHITRHRLYGAVERLHGQDHPGASARHAQDVRTRPDGHA
jgi:nicotinate-nucleotide adenylyltransferase